MTSIRLNVFLTIVCIWFSACLFACSALLCNVYNGMKAYIAHSGFLFLLLFTLVFVKDLRKYASKNLSWNLFQALYLCGAIQGIYGILQWIINTNNCRTAGYGVSGSFDNPSGFASVLAMLFPIGIVWFLKGKGFSRFYICFFVLVYLTAIVLSLSRTSLIAVLVSSFIVLSIETDFLLWLKTHKKTAICIAGALICLSAILFVWKLPSVYGRLYIWKITLKMILEHPFLGYGINGFQAHFMVAQSDYFLANPNSCYAFLADNIRHPMNEFLSITVRFGLAGLSIFSFFSYKIFKKALSCFGWKKSVLTSSFSSFFMLSLFTYPLHYAPIWIILVIQIASLFCGCLPSQINIWHRLIMCIIPILGLKALYSSFVSQMEWKRIAHKSLLGYTEEMLPIYEILRNKTKLAHNGQFLYNYAAELNYIEKYNESLEILADCRKYIFDYDVALLYADNMYSTNKYDSAITYATLAANMIPCRFMPYHYLLNATIDKKDSIQARRIADEILKKSIKVNSGNVERIRCEAIKYLEDTNNLNK